MAKASITYIIPRPISLQMINFIYLKDSGAMMIFLIVKQIDWLTTMLIILNNARLYMMNYGRTQSLFKISFNSLIINVNSKCIVA